MLMEIVITIIECLIALKGSYTDGQKRMSPLVTNSFTLFRAANHN